MSSVLWFDVESKYEATLVILSHTLLTLWFDVESKYEATNDGGRLLYMLLWFDVESKYEATNRVYLALVRCCGLM